MTTPNQNRSSYVTIDQQELDRLRSNVLTSQITTYRYLARNLPVSDSLLNSCSLKLQLANLVQSRLPREQVDRGQIILSHTSTSENPDSTDKPSVFSSTTEMYQSLTGAQNIYDEKLPHQVQKHPISLNPLYIQQEQEKRVASRIANRLQELEQMPATMNTELRTQALIEFKSLKLLQLQKQLRNELLTTMKKDKYIETALNPRAYKRPKRHLLREARLTELHERQRKLDIKRQKQARRQAFLSAILNHAREFREFHRRCALTRIRTNKAIQTCIANNERDLIRGREREKRDRLKYLMIHDEENYRKLVDKEKDARLDLLLSQTDAYIDTLKQLVRQHQQSSRPNQLLVSQTMTNQTEVSTKTTEDSLATEQELKSTSTTDETNDGKTIRDALKIAATTVDDEYDAKESYYSIAHGIREPIKQQSAMLVGGQLKEYQLHGLEWLVSLYNNNLNGILADEMGLGKTIQTIALIVHLVDYKKNLGPFLIIVPLSTLSNWAAEFQRWAPDITVIQYKGLPQVRTSLGQTIRTSRFNVLLTTYEYIMRDRTTLSKVHWKYLIIDEGHRMKNHHCKLTQILNTYYSHASHRLLLTGTPLQNNLSELWALLNFILPNIFKSSATFTDWFNAPFATLPSEKVELNPEETLLIISRLHKVLRPFLLRRLKKEVESQLPEKVEYIIKCELSALQRSLYHAMDKNRTLIIKNQNGKGGRRALMNKIMQLRKICNHPFLFHEIEERLAQTFGYKEGVITGPDLFRASGKFELLDRILPKLKASGHKVLLFCQMTSVMDLLEYYFAYRSYSYIRLDGTTKADDRTELLKNFNDDNVNCFIFLLSTHAGGVGLNLQKADTVILFDSDWNPHQDQQAQDRAHRIGQKNEVRVLRLMTVNTIEEKILLCARQKLNVDEKVIQAGKFNRSSTSLERHDYLEQLLEGEDESNNNDEDIPDDEILNQMIARTESEFDLFNRIDVARREYESCHGVGSGGDGAAERRAWKLASTIDDKNITSQVKRKKENMNEDSIDQTVKSSKSSTSLTVEQSDDDITREGTLTANYESLPLPLDELDDEEDVDYTRETPMVHRKMKKTRLMTEDELPEWLKNDVDEFEKTLEDEKEFGKGCRQRKDVDYRDNLTEREFLQALEEGDLEDLLEQKRTQKQGSKFNTTVQGSNIDLDETEACSSFDTPSTSTSNQLSISSKRGSVKKRSEIVDPKVAPQCRLLFDHLLAYRTEDDRQLAEVFIRLPTQKQLPLYYRIIKEPIDFQRIRRKIDTFRYSSLEQFDADIKLLIENAQAFNRDTSVIYSDSVLLGKVYQDLCDKLKSGLLKSPIETTNTTTIDDPPRTIPTTSKRGRGRRPIATTPTRAVSTRGRKRKVINFKDDGMSDDEQIVLDNCDNQEN